MEITDVNTLFGAYPSQHPNSNPESLVGVMQEQGVDWCLTLSTYGLFHHDREGNDETMRACRSHDHLIPVATLNPSGYWGQDDVIGALVGDAFEMFRFFPHRQGWPLEFAPFLDILQTLARGKRMPVMVSVTHPGDATCLARLAGDYPYPLILEGVSERTLTEAIAVMRRHSRLYLETHALHVPDALLLLRDTVGIERILFGSDAPGMSLAAALRSVRRSGLSERDQSAVLGLNAQQIWSGSSEER